jgi:hypothetical protein
MQMSMVREWLWAMTSFGFPGMIRAVGLWKTATPCQTLPVTLCGVWLP